MAASKSTYLRNAVYNAAFRNTAFTGAAQLYMSLHTASPGLVGSNEVSGNAYARVAISMGAPTGGAGASVTSAVTFPAPTPANWGTVTHFGIWDALTTGNYYGGDA